MKKFLGFTLISLGLIACGGTKKAPVNTGLPTETQAETTAEGIVDEGTNTTETTAEGTTDEVSIGEYDIPEVDTNLDDSGLDAETAAKLAELEKLAQDNPKDKDALFSLGMEYFSAEIWDEALKNFEAVLEKDKKHKQALVKAGVCSKVLGQDFEATEYFKRAVKRLKGKDQELIDEVASFIDEAFPVTQITFGDYHNALAKFSPYDDKIVYQTNRNGNWDIIIADANGENELNLTEASESDEENPSFNSTATAILFTSTENGSGPKESKYRDIHEIDLNEYTQSLVIEDIADDWSPTYSSDGTQIAFTSERNDLRRAKFYTLQSDVYLYDTALGNVSRVSNQNYDTGNPIFASTSELIVASSKNGNFDLMKIGTDGTEISTLTKSIADDGSPSLSGNKEKIAFASERYGNTEIFVMNADGSNLMKVTTNSALDGYPSISYNGDRVIFTSRRGGTYQIYEVNLLAKKTYSKDDLENLLGM